MSPFIRFILVYDYRHYFTEGNHLERRRELDDSTFDNLVRSFGRTVSRRSAMKSVAALMASAVAGPRLISAVSAQTSLKLPFPSGETWFFTGGPHTYSGSILNGIDFATPARIDCKSNPKAVSESWALAAADGTVTKVRKSDGVVEILHDDGHTGTGYGHLANIKVKAGDRVEQGAPLGQPGCVGNTTGTHIHFYFLSDGIAVPAAGQMLSGWTIGAGSVPYLGSLSKNGQIIVQTGGGTRAGTGITSDNTLVGRCSKKQVICNGSCIDEKCSSKGQELDFESCSCECPANSCGSGAHSDFNNKCKCTCDDDDATMCKDGTCKTCGPNAKLNKKTCTCECKRNLEHCKDGCYEPCTGGRQRNLETCECLGTCPAETSFCAGTLECLPDCPDGEWRDDNLCKCFCNAGLTRCGETCVDTQSDDHHCGSCDNPCSQIDGERCCNGNCTDTLHDSQHCGTCDNACPEGSICDEGKGCCPEGQAVCGDGCVDTSVFLSDPNNCGQCGRQCAEGTNCQNADCVSATTGTIVIYAQDADTGAPALGGTYGLYRASPVEFFDGRTDETFALDSFLDPWLVPGDGNADGIVTLTDVPPGQYLVRFIRMVQSHAGHLGTQMFHDVIVTAGETSELVLPLLTTEGTDIEIAWVDSSNNQLSDEFLRSITTENSVVPVGNTWATFRGGIGLTNFGNGRINGEEFTWSGQLLGAGQYEVGATYLLDSDSQFKTLPTQTVSVSLGQVTRVEMVIDLPASTFASAGQSNVVECSSDLTDCNGTCVNTLVDILHCGGCGLPCATGEICESGQCVAPVPDSTPTSDQAETVTECESGLTWCGQTCIDLATDVLNCGSCGMDCGPDLDCVDGLCVPAAPGTPEDAPLDSTQEDVADPSV